MLHHQLIALPHRGLAPLGEFPTNVPESLLSLRYVLPDSVIQLVHNSNSSASFRASAFVVDE